MRPLQADDPRQVGAYRLVGRLGAGGMGVVYLGRSPGGRSVAVKTVREGLARDARFRARFRREVAAARTVTGLFTAPLLDADPQAAVPWLVTEYLPGLSLREAVGLWGYRPRPSGSGGGLPAATVRLLAAALAEALADIHQADLTHRDLKPENIMLTADGPRVIDFGIARPEDASQITLPGVPLGTPGFMAPEQASGDRAGPASDVFALGAVLVFAATGEEPFAAEDRAATLARVRQARVDLGVFTDRRLRMLIASCLRREPGRRPSAAALLDRLGEPVTSVQGTRWLPALLAEEIDRQTARPGAPDHSFLPKSAAALSEHLALAGEVTADPAAQAEATDADAAGGATPNPGAPHRRARDRRAPDQRGPNHHGPNHHGQDHHGQDHRHPDRRKLLMAVAAVPVAAAGAVALGKLVSSVTDGKPPRSSPARSSPPPSSSRGTATAAPSRPAVPPQATSLWRIRLIDDDGGAGDDSGAGGKGQAGPADHPDLYTAGDVVLAALTNPVDRSRTDVHALVPRTGRILWSQAISVGTNAQVTVADGAVCLVDPRPDGDDAGRSVLRARHPVSGATRWTYHVPDLDFVWGTAALGSLVYVVANARVTALNAADGRQRWVTPTEFEVQGAGAPLVELAYTVNDKLTKLKGVPLPWRETFRVPPVAGGVSWQLRFTLPSGTVTYRVSVNGRKVDGRKEPSHPEFGYPYDMVTGGSANVAGPAAGPVPGTEV